MSDQVETIDGDTSRRFLVAVITLTVVMNAIGRGVAETFAVFLLPVEKEFGASRGAMGATYSIYMLAYGIAAPAAGQLFDRCGARVCYGVGLASLALGYLLAAHAPSLGLYYLAVGVLGGIGAAALGMVAASSLLARWFTRRMASVASLPYAAMGAGMLIFPPAAQLLIDGVGWRRAYTVLGLVVAAVLVVVMLLPLARVSAGSHAWQTQRRTAAADGNAWTMSSALRTGAFWWLFLTYFGTSVAAYSVLPHSVAYLVENGFHPLVAASAFGMTGIASALGIIAVGWAADRFGWRTTVTVTFLSTMTGIAALMAIERWPSLFFLYSFVIFFGAMQGARGPILVALVSRIFAGGSVGTIFGALSLALGAGAAVGSILSGYLYQVTGNYRAAFTCSLIACLVALYPYRVARSIREERVIARW